MADEKEPKLGPSVTYVGNSDDDKEAVTMAGVRFKPGESVNLEDRLGKEKAQPLLKSLAGNRFFKVDGGPDHAADQKKRDEAQAKADQDAAKDAEEARKAKEAKAQPAKTGEPVVEGGKAKKPGSPTFE